MPRKKAPPRPRGLCEICGALIPHKPGMPAKTCGEACAKERHRRIEHARYHREKHTPKWKAARAAYLDKLRARLDADPEYAAMFRAYSREQTKKSRLKRHADPAVRARELAAQREERRQWRERLVQDEQAWEAHKAKCRAWYHGLSEADRERIYREPQRRRLKSQEKPQVNIERKAATLYPEYFFEGGIPQVGDATGSVKKTRSAKKAVSRVKDAARAVKAAVSHCEICGADIPPRPGKGKQAKICGSAECKAERVRRYMRAYYQKLKNTPELAERYEAIKERINKYAHARYHDNPEVRAREAKRYRDNKARIDSDPVLRQQYLEKERARGKRKWEAIKQDPQKLQAYREYMREAYKRKRKQQTDAAEISSPK